MNTATTNNLNCKKHKGYISTLLSYIIQIVSLKDRVHLIMNFCVHNSYVFYGCTPSQNFYAYKKPFFATKKKRN